ncbi:dTDP-4-dehydrorhamnose reductase [Noviherbaspirillum soli]|uniref:dTDP-4-dehydrorhamnose reductase n=1 Tax=Noviherbaspirillum soli TaxID=1064518 RepID=UPI00188B29A9|nr:dTDP-4-dehydrorhamnose reductase [Noviherbaspirillum soli]
MKILITGKTGQVGYELERSLQSLGTVASVDRKQMDLSDLSRIRQVIRDIKPDLIVNPAAYTAVDKAEEEPDVAMRINGEAVGVMAEEAKLLNAKFIHYSTDYVFDGTKIGSYVEEDIPNPINIYGKTKLAGERALQDSGVPHLIFRTSWVYGTRGKNFLLTMLRLGKEKKELRIVSDQIGGPTWCRTISDTTANVLVHAYASKTPEEWWEKNSGIYHLAAQGQTSWAGFADAIFSRMNSETSPIVHPIFTKEYPLPAQRPANSLLDCQRIKTKFCALPKWDDALDLCMM